MPIIVLSQEAIDNSKQPEIGWSPAKLVGVNEAPTKEGKENSVNYFFTFILEGGPEKEMKNAGRTVTRFFNNHALGMGGNGSKSGVPELVHLYRTMISALLGLTSFEETKAGSYDTDKLIGKTCWVHVNWSQPYKGKSNLTAVDFSAYGDIPF
jgi:hypothetical protein